jgi:hypothetical protein
MQSESWVREISVNDRRENVLRLTQASSRIPIDAYITGAAPDPHMPPIGTSPIEITWPSGKMTKHFVRADTNRNMITDRTDAVRTFYESIGAAVTHIVITALDDGHFIITPRRT